MSSRCKFIIFFVAARLHYTGENINQKVPETNPGEDTEGRYKMADSSWLTRRACALAQRAAYSFK